ncbi:MAG: hypothetical protein M3249_02935, partial [Thermoproteota archaeon]|nr:hypothetical protein [Thermoproteota archaeon]
IMSPKTNEDFLPNIIKAQLHTWLSWQHEPGTPLGLAITKRYLEADTLHAQRLITWIRRLFIQPQEQNYLSNPAT